MAKPKDAMARQNNSQSLLTVFWEVKYVKSFRARRNNTNRSKGK
jgi:hypothetical protein